MSNTNPFIGSLQRSIIEEGRAHATASNGKGAVMVTECLGLPLLVKFAPESLASPERQDELDALYVEAAARLGFKRDKRYTNGWRRIKA